MWLLRICGFSDNTFTTAVVLDRAIGGDVWILSKSLSIAENFAISAPLY